VAERIRRVVVENAIAGTTARRMATLTRSDFPGTGIAIGTDGTIRRQDREVFAH